MVCAPLMLPGVIWFTVTVSVSSLKHPDALTKCTVTELPFDMVEIEAV